MEKDETLAKANGLHVQLRVEDGKLVMRADADPGCKTAMHHADEVLRIAADDLEKRRRLATTLGQRPTPGRPVKEYVN